jgi:2-polyprenyl-3-methyl-5-hydroxy-6-metoxy-1,4-benzoquinol methylase
MPLEKQPGDLVCSSCGPQARWVDGIPCFRDPEYYWGEIPKQEMQLANRLACERGWQAAVDEVVREKILHDYICDPRRADFQYLWNLPSDSSILDVGAGWGTIATALAHNFSQVVAAEGVLERCRFIHTRARQANLPVEVVCADFLALPFDSGQFDAVVLNGVLEWSAMAAEGDPRECQLRFLRSIHRMLKSGGVLYVGIENRIGWEMLKGSGDHSGLSYTSLLPRKLASLRCRMNSRQFRSSANVGYRTYTYSLRGYRKLFREAGYGDVSAFHAWNGYNDPTVLLPLENSAALLHFLDSCQLGRKGSRGKIKDAVLRIGAHTGLWGQFASDFAFLAKRP